jgi:hypothetical protein
MTEGRVGAQSDGGTLPRFALQKKKGAHRCSKNGSAPPSPLSGCPIHEVTGYEPGTSKARTGTIPSRSVSPPGVNHPGRDIGTPLKGCVPSVPAPAYLGPGQVPEMSRLVPCPGGHTRDPWPIRKGTCGAASLAQGSRVGRVAGVSTIAKGVGQ